MRASTIHLVLLLLAAPSGAVEPADSAGVSPPPQLSAPARPAEPPGWMPADQSEPSLAELEALEHEGIRKQHVGGALLAVGTGLTLVGTGLLIAGSWDDGGCYGHYYYETFAYTYGSGYYASPGRGWCGNASLAAAGAVSTIVGIGTIIAGASIGASGHHDVAVARAVRRCGWASLSVRPSISREGAGLVLALTP